MKKGVIILLVILAVLFLTAVCVISWVVGTHNSLVSMQEDARNKASNIEAQLQRRADLIPNLVATAKGYASHEEAVFTAIAEARAKLSGAISSENMEAMAEANDGLSNALSRLLVVVEQYPELKADKQFTALMDELAGTENRINYAREQYNESVSIYNKKIRMFPESIIANMNGFTAMKYFEVAEGASEVPVVNFD